jgi:apolipoprotein N-acyltransferase
MNLVSRKYLGGIVAALTSGALLSLPLSFPGSAAWLSWLVPLALVPLFIALERLPVQGAGGARSYHRVVKVTAWNRAVHALVLFWIAGAVFCGMTMSWGTVALLRSSELSPPVAYGLFFCFCLLSGLYFPLVFSPFVIGAARGVRKHANMLPIWAMVLVTTGIEIWFPRNWSWTFGSLADFSYAVNQWVSLFGTSALTPLVVGGSAYLARSVVGSGASALRSVLMLASLLGIWVLVFALGEWRLSVMDNRVDGIRRTQVAVILPGGLATKGKRDVSPEAAGARLDSLIEVTRTTVSGHAGDGKVELVVWPKDELSEQFSFSPDQLEKVRALARELTVPILVSADEFDFRDGPQEITAKTVGYKAAFLIRPDGSKSESYRQRYLTPFEGNLPFEETFPFLTNIVKKQMGQPRRWRSGSATPALSFSPEFRLGVLLSFDAMHPDVAQREVGRADDVETGEAGLLVHLSSFWSVAGTDAPEILQGMARWRAIEVGRSLISIGASGDVWAFDPLGRTIAKRAIREAKGTVVKLPAFDPDTAFDTFFSDFRNSIYGVFVVIAAAVLLFSLFRRSH